MDKLAILGFSEKMEISEFLSNKTLLRPEFFSDFNVLILMVKQN